MGAEFHTNYVRAGGRSLAGEAGAVYIQLVNNAKHDHGHAGYTGTIAESPSLRITTQIFYTIRAAEEWLLANTEKWEETKVVSVRLDDGEYWVFGGVYSS